MKREWLKNDSNYFVTCKYFRLILESLQTVKNVYMHIYIYIYIYIYKHIYIYILFFREKLRIFLLLLFYISFFLYHY